MDGFRSGVPKRGPEAEGRPSGFAASPRNVRFVSRGKPSAAHRTRALARLARQRAHAGFDDHLTHFAITERREGATVQWMEQVTDRHCLG